MNKELFGITWHAWHVVYALPLLLVAFSILWWQHRKRIKFLALFNQKLIKHYSLWVERIKKVAFVLGLIFLFMTALQPGWGKQEEQVEQEGRDLVVALDISRSMLAEDRQPSRLEFAKHKIRQLLMELRAERVALIVFSGSSVVQCPLTTDYAAFELFLDQIDAETISSGSTALDAAIKQAMRLFDDMPVRKNKLLMVLTDGEDFSSNLTGIKQQAAEKALTIFTFGIGTTAGAPVPLIDDRGVRIGHQQDEHGAIVMSRLNESLLKTLSEATGGRYLSAESGTDDIKSLMKEVERYEREKFDAARVDTALPRYYYFAAASLFCFLLEWIL